MAPHLPWGPLPTRAPAPRPPQADKLSLAPEEERASALTMLAAVAGKVAEVEAKAVVDLLVGVASKFAPADALRFLVDLFNFTGAAQRPAVMRAVLALGSSDAALGGLVHDMTNGKLGEWCREWGLGLGDRAALFLLAAGAATTAGAPAKEVMSLYNTAFQALDGRPLAQGGAGALAAVSAAAKLFLGSPGVFECDMLASSAVQQAPTSPEMVAIVAMISGDLAGVQAVLAQHPGLPEQCGTTKDAVLGKARTMALLVVAQKAVGSEVSYAEVAAALDLAEGDGEAKVVEVVGSGLAQAKLDQVRRVLTIQRWAHCTLTPVNWAQIREKLTDIKAALATSGDALRAAAALEVTGNLGADAPLMV